MSYHRVAYGKGVNQRGDTKYVVLYKHTSGTDQSREFHLGPDGFRESYEGPSQTALMPGIWTQKLEVTTIWENPSELESVLSDIASGADGLFFMQVRSSATSSLRQGTPFYVILPEAISVADDAENVQATFVGTDGLAMFGDKEINFPRPHAMLARARAVKSQRAAVHLMRQLLGGDHFFGLVRVYHERHVEIPVARVADQRRIEPARLCFRHAFHHGLSKV